MTPRERFVASQQRMMRSYCCKRGRHLIAVRQAVTSFADADCGARHNRAENPSEEHRKHCIDPLLKEIGVTL